MNKKLGILITTILTALSFGSAFSACGKEVQTKYDFKVDFDYNIEVEGVDLPEMSVGVLKGNALNLYPGSGNNLLTLKVIGGYRNSGWYEAKLDANGEALKNPDGTVVIDTSKKWIDADSTLVCKDEVTKSFTLYADYKKVDALLIMEADGDSVFKTINRDPGEKFDARTRDSNKPTKQGSTFVGFYADKECTVPFSWPYVFSDSGSEVRVYSKFMEGNWSVVKDVDEFKDAMADSNTRQGIWLEGDIDFAGTEWITPQNGFMREICGNGHTIKNITKKDTIVSNTAGNISLFGTLTSYANIHDVTIENVNFNVTINRLGVGFEGVAILAKNAIDGATLTNVTVKNSAINLKGSESDMNNIPCGTVCVDASYVQNVTITNCNFDGISVNK